jgi:hypothetical protein
MPQVQSSIEYHLSSRKLYISTIGNFSLKLIIYPYILCYFLKENICFFKSYIHLALIVSASDGKNILSDR